MGKLKRLSKEIVLQLSVVVLTTAAAIVLTHTVAFLTQAERFVEDLRVATLLPPEPQDPDIVIAAINEDTLQLFPYRSPVDRAFLSNLLKALEQRQPRAIAMDILLDQSTEPTKDAELKETIANLKVPVVDQLHQQSRDRRRQAVRLSQSSSFRPKTGSRPRSPPTRSEPRAGSSPRSSSATARPCPASRAASSLRSASRRPNVQPEMVWHGRPDRQTPPFRIFPSHLVPVLPPAWVKDKIVLIGEVVSAHRSSPHSVLVGLWRQRGKPPGHRGPRQCGLAAPRTTGRRAISASAPRSWSCW